VNEANRETPDGTGMDGRISLTWNFPATISSRKPSMPSHATGWPSSGCPTAPGWIRQHCCTPG